MKLPPRGQKSRGCRCISCTSGRRRPTPFPSSCRTAGPALCWSAPRSSHSLPVRGAPHQPSQLRLLADLGCSSLGYHVCCLQMSVPASPSTSCVLAFPATAFLKPPRSPVPLRSTPSPAGRSLNAPVSHVSLVVTSRIRSHQDRLHVRSGTPPLSLCLASNCDGSLTETAPTHYLHMC
jgi:hypothetical protein